MENFQAMFLDQQPLQQQQKQQQQQQQQQQQKQKRQQQHLSYYRLHFDQTLKLGFLNQQQFQQ